jgi:hypothetical protein
MGHATAPLHPLKIWRTSPERGFSPRDVSALLEARGLAFKERTVIAVEDGWRLPSYKVCEAIEEISHGAITVPQLRHWPLRAVRTAKKKRA